MKKLIILFALASCGEPDNTPISIDKEFGERYGYVIIDSCEYIRTNYAPGNPVAHKGNCKFCQRRSKLK